jgi:tol-pal system protein YbgF
MVYGRPIFSASVLVLLSGISGASPAAAANKEQKLMMADIRMLQEQTQQLQLQIAALLEGLKTVSSRMDVKLDEQSAVSRKAFADQKLLVDTVAGDLRVVREKADETNVRVTSLTQEIEALRQAMPPPGSVTIPAPVPSDAGGAVAPVLAAPSPTPGTLGVSPTRAFDTAWADYTAGQYTLSIQGFETFIKTFPKSDQADDATWYIGESYFGLGRFEQALAAYDRVIADYPGSNQAPLAYYKKGLTLTSLGRTQPAREAFETAVKNYPDSDAGRLARQQLDRLNRK